MLSIGDQLVREISALYGFVDSISVLCSRVPQSVAFTEPSFKFFQHVGKLAAASKSHLLSFDVGKAESANDDDFHEMRDELRTIRSAWKELHKFIKAAIDADTLNQPSALISFMVARMRQLPGMSAADFAIFHTDEFNYLQVNPTSIRQALKDFVFIVGGEEFSSSLGLIGIPGTQGSSVLMNCLVAHEIGEYVYAEKQLHNHFQPEVKTALGLVFGAEYTGISKTDKSFYIDRVLNWIKELFCDLFAVYLVGPSYTIAYLELFDLLNLLDKGGAIKNTAPQPPVRFYSAHPSHPFRVKHQTDLLKKLDWWPHLRNIDSRYIRVMDALSALDDDTSFVDPKDGINKRLVESFLKVLPEVGTLLGKLMGSLDPGVHEFSELYIDIRAYFSEGIVPSTIVSDRAGNEPVVIRPPGMALLNSFACFYLGDIEKIMNRVGQKPTSIEQRVYWSKKLESWTSKALEDIALFSET